MPKTRFIQIVSIVFSTTFIVAAPLHSLNAQTSKTDPVDGQAWYGLEVKKKLNKDWSIALAWQGRNYNNMQTHNGDYYSIAVSKQFRKAFDLQSEYRLGQVAKGTYHRYSLGGSWQQKFHQVKLSTRILFQNQLQDFNDIAKSNEQSLYIRTRFGAKIKCTSWLSIYAQTEPIAKMGGRKVLDNIRNTIGTSFSFSEHVDADLYYIYRPDFAKSYVRTYHILGVEVQYKF